MQRLRRLPLLLLAVTATFASACASLGPAVGVPPRVVEVPVLVLSFEPALEGYRAPTLREELGWSHPRALADSLRTVVREASRDGVRYRIVDWRTIDGFPLREDGVRLDLESYRQCVEEETGCPSHGALDLPALLRQYGVPALVKAGFADEVWLFGGPHMGLGDPVVLDGSGSSGADLDIPHPLPILSFDYSEGVGDMLFDFCRRVEAALTDAFGPTAVPTTPWGRYTTTIAEADTAGVGRCDHAPNALVPLQYTLEREVPSTAPAWLGYPSLEGLVAPVSHENWGRDRHGYLRWWLFHLPAVPRTDGGAPLSDWWRGIYQASM